MPLLLRALPLALAARRSAAFSTFRPATDFSARAGRARPSSGHTSRLGAAQDARDDERWLSAASSRRDVASTDAKYASRRREDISRHACTMLRACVQLGLLMEVLVFSDKSDTAPMIYHAVG